MLDLMKQGCESVQFSMTFDSNKCDITTPEDHVQIKDTLQIHAI